MTEWEVDCVKWHGYVLSGKFKHWCYDWDGLPIDETCDEFTCCNDVDGADAEAARDVLRTQDTVK